MNVCGKDFKVRSSCHEGGNPSVPLLSVALTKSPAATNHSIEISIKGRWVRVPALNVNTTTIVVAGKWIKVAFVAHEEYLPNELEDPELCLKELRERKSHGPRADIFTFAQTLSTTFPIYEYPLEWESIAAVHTTNSKNWWNNLPRETRKSLRQSQKRGVEVRAKELDDELIRGIMGVNNDSMMRQRKAFVHYGKDFAQVKKDQSSFLGRSDFICAYIGDELIGFLKIAYSGETASIVQILSKPSHYDKRPNNSLIQKAVEVCEERGMSYLTYGKFNYGNKGDSTLREFKIRNGFEEILVPRFYIPLTKKGELCMKMNLHRGLLGILPHSLIVARAKARAKWNELRQKLS